jgi:rubrerythrin
MKKLAICIVVTLTFILGIAAIGNAAKLDDIVVKNLQEAYNGESNASAKYAAYAQKAEKEGYLSVAIFFRAASQAEAIHAANHARVLAKYDIKPVSEIKPAPDKSTKEMIEDAIAGETYEFTTMYPGFIEHAKSVGASDAVASFRAAMEAEKIHAKIYTEALNDLEKWKAGDKVFAVCSTCGWTVEGAAPMICPICGMPEEQFIVFNASTLRRS